MEPISDRRSPPPPKPTQASETSPEGEPEGAQAQHPALLPHSSLAHHVEQLLDTLERIANDGTYVLTPALRQSLLSQATVLSICGLITLAASVRSLADVNSAIAIPLLKTRYLCQLYQQADLRERIQA